MGFLLIVTATVLGQPGVRSHLPNEIQQLIAHPTWETSEIEWTLSHYDDPEVGLVERHITRTAGTSVWQTNLGDERGRHRTRYHSYPDDPVPKLQDAGPRDSMLFEGDLWYVEHNKDRSPLTGTVAPGAAGLSHYPIDFDMLGFAPWCDNLYGNGLGLREVHVEGLQNADVSTMTRGDLQTLTASYDRYELQWQLDRRRGGRPVLAALYIDGELAYTSQTEWREENGSWLPISSRFFLRDEPVPQQEIRVTKATHDQSWHRKDLTPNDIGVLFGTQLAFPNGGPRFWDGVKILTETDYDELVRLYGFRPDPAIVDQLAQISGMATEEFLAVMDETTEQWRTRYQREHGNAPWINATKAEETDEWDRYVAAFIADHKLAKVQIELAEKILKQAKQLRDFHRRHHRADVRKAERTGDTRKTARIEAIEERIFERVLKRGLLRILPREKRRQE